MQITRTRILAVILPGLLLGVIGTTASCSRQNSSKPTLVVTVISRTSDVCPGGPCQGATVEIAETHEKTVTDATGNAGFVLPPGSYTVHAQGPKGCNQDASVTVKADTTEYKLIFC